MLHSPYTFEKAKLVLQEMVDSLSLDLLEKQLVTDQLVLTVGYDIENISQDGTGYDGEIVVDAYGRQKPKHAHGTVNLDSKTSSARLMTKAVLDLYDKIVNRRLYIRRLTLVAARIIDENTAKSQNNIEQLDLFSTITEADRQKEEKALEKEKRLQKTVLDLKHKYGKNAILKGMNFMDGATMKERNGQIGGHRAGEKL